MQPEHESAVAAWLDDISTKREVDIVKQRFPGISELDAAQFALNMEILVALNLYGEPDIIIERRTDDDDPPEPWRSDPDATGFSP